MAFKDDRDALESLPLKLAIISVVASLSVVPAGQALESFRNRDFVNRAQLELESIISTAQVLMLEGPGAVRTIHIDLASAGRLDFHTLVIGDAKGGPNMSAVILVLTSGGTLVRIAAEPEVWLRGSDGGALTITSSRFDLRLSTQLVDHAAFVLVEVV